MPRKPNVIYSTGSFYREKFAKEFFPGSQDTHAQPIPSLEAHVPDGPKGEEPKPGGTIPVKLSIARGGNG
jgi:hypothetical protein